MILALPIFTYTQPLITRESYSYVQNFEIPKIEEQPIENLQIANDFWELINQVQITKISKKLDLITSLPDNWDGYGACPIDIVVSDNVKFIFSILPTNFVYCIKISNINPSANGTIMLEWNVKNNYLLVDIGEKYATLAANFCDNTNAAIDRIGFTKKDVLEIVENLHKLYANEN
jgi:hypothetical protein